MDKRFKKLCLDLLEGNTSTLEENELLGFLADSEGRREFFELEEFWSSVHNPDVSQLKEFKKIKREITGKQRLYRAVFPAVSVAAMALILFLLRPSVESSSDSRQQLEQIVLSTQCLEQRTEILPDGTKVSLNSASSISYAADFCTNREVILSGEAYFDVAKDSLHRFTVKARDNEISVYGTKFNVCAYGDATSVTAALVEGSIVFSNDALTMIMKPGEVLNYDCSTGAVFKKTADVGSYISWMSGRLDYESISLSDLFARLSSVYSLDIRYSAAKYAQSRFRISLNIKEPIDNILHAVATITPIRWTRDGNVISIMEL